MRLMHHDKPDERAQQEKTKRVLAEVDKPRVAGVVDEEIPRIHENERAAEKAALLENLVPFSSCAHRIPLAGQPEKGDEPAGSRCPAGGNEPDRDDPQQHPGNSRFTNARGLITGRAATPISPRERGG